MTRTELVVVPKMGERRPEGVVRKDLTATVAPVASTDPNGEFLAIASTEGVDRDGEVIQFGAFNPLPPSIPVFANHDPAFPVGRAVPFYDGRLLKVRGAYASTPRAQELRTLVAEGVVDSMSVGFVNSKRSTVRGQKTVTKGELIEVSFTAIPVNAEARVLAAKAAGARRRSERDELWLRAKRIELRALAYLHSGVDITTGRDVGARLRTIEGGKR